MAEHPEHSSLDQTTQDQSDQDGHTSVLARVGQIILLPIVMILMGSFLAALWALVIVITEPGELPREYLSAIAIMAISVVVGLPALGASVAGDPPAKAIGIFVLTACLATGFGGVYRCVYLADPLAFTMPADVRQSQALGQVAAFQRSLLRVNDELYYLYLLESHPDFEQAVHRGEVLTAQHDCPYECCGWSMTLLPIPDGTHATYKNPVEVTYDYANSRQGASGKLRIRAPNFDVVYGGPFRRGDESIPVCRIADAKTVEDFRERLSDVRAVFEERRDQIVRKMAEASRGNPHLGVFDFIYFSAVSMTTIQDREFIPASSFVRTVTAIQRILMLTLVLGVVLTFIGSALSRVQPLSGDEGILSACDATGNAAPV